MRAYILTVHNDALLILLFLPVHPQYAFAHSGIRLLFFPDLDYLTLLIKSLVTVTIFLTLHPKNSDNIFNIRLVRHLLSGLIPVTHAKILTGLI